MFRWSCVFPLHRPVDVTPSRTCHCHLSAHFPFACNRICSAQLIMIIVKLSVSICTFLWSTYAQTYTHTNTLSFDSSIKVGYAKTNKTVFFRSCKKATTKYYEKKIKKNLQIQISSFIIYLEETLILVDSFVPFVSCGCMHIIHCYLVHFHHTLALLPSMMIFFLLYSFVHSILFPVFLMWIFSACSWLHWMENERIFLLLLLKDLYSCWNLWIFFSLRSFLFLDCYTLGVNQCLKNVCQMSSRRKAVSEWKIVSKNCIVFIRYKLEQLILD